MSLLDYLSEHFLTRRAVLAAAGINDAELARLQAQRLAPQASYRLQLEVNCSSYFGPHSESCEQEYYARGMPEWLASIRNCVDEAVASALFRASYVQRLEELEAEDMPDLQAEWRAFLDGTYGLCTRSGLPHDIAAKELATRRIEAMLAAGKRGPALQAAVELLDASASLFAPHERQRSSRQRYVDALRA